MKFFLFHCWGGWLENELTSLGYSVTNPDFPETDNPNIKDWLIEVRKRVQKFESKDEWVLISHSLGGPTILNLLETFDQNEKVKAVIIVAGFGKDLGIPQIRNFADHQFDWAKIKSKSEKFIVINSDNDPYIKLEEGERVAKLLSAESIIEHNGGHINEPPRFLKYTRLLEIIKNFEK